VKRCGKSAPRLRRRRRHGKPHREQDRIGAARGFGCTCTFACASGRPGAIPPAARVGCLRRRASGVPDEWPSRRGDPPDRTRLIGRLTFDRRDHPLGGLEKRPAPVGSPAGQAGSRLHRHPCAPARRRRAVGGCACRQPAQLSRPRPTPAASAAAAGLARVRLGCGTSLLGAGCLGAKERRSCPTISRAKSPIG
jgi:hypothetical protein